MNDCLSEIQQKVADGCVQSFGRLHQLYYSRLKAFACSMIHSTQLAEEVVEDVFVQLWVNRSHITSIENLVVYLYKATKNRSLNALTALSRSLITEGFDHLEVDVHQASNPYELMVTAELMEKMNEAVNSLPPKCKMIFKLVREDSLKYKEVAEVLNISVNTIDVQMAIAVERICKALNIQKLSKKKVIII